MKKFVVASHLGETSVEADWMLVDADILFFYRNLEGERGEVVAVFSQGSWWTATELPLEATQKV